MLAAAWITAAATGLLAALAAVTAWYARRAFREQSREVRAIEQQVHDQSATNTLQVEDLRESLKERTRQRSAAERQQADLIGFRMTAVSFPSFSDRDSPSFAVNPGDRVHLAMVANGSRRPIRNVVCRTGNPAKTELPVTDSSWDMAVIVGRLASPEIESDSHSFRDEVPVFFAARIRPGEVYGFVFEIPVHPRQFMNREAVRFTDDAGLHWQIDHELHLHQLDDRNDW